MIPIRFNAWDKKDKKMVTVSSIDWGNQYIEYDNGVELKSLCLESVILLQYIGKKDKNKVEIYNGSILKSDLTGEYGEVFWSEEHASFYCSNGCSLLHTDELEIVGNIYENKELLEVKQ